MFKEGDIVIGRNQAYGHTGEGSISRVLRVNSAFNSMTIEVIKPLPRWCEAGKTFEVSTELFELKPHTPMKIEAIKVYRCQQEVRGDGPCDEVAEHRVTIPGLSITLCEAHAQSYIKGVNVLEAVRCSQCATTCKPGYIYDREYGLPFCNEWCAEGYRNREPRRQYA